MHGLPPPLLSFFLLIFFPSLSIWSAQAENVLPDEQSPIDLRIVVIAQRNDGGFEWERAKQLLERWGMEEEHRKRFDFTLLHRKFGDKKSPDDEKYAPLEGYWAIWPALQRLMAEPLAKWTLFSRPFVALPNVTALIGHLLHNWDYSKPTFIGNAQMDESPTIIHHYHSGFLLDGRRLFLYPDLSSTGFCLSLSALQQIFAYFGSENKKAKGKGFRPNFIIDPGFEFAQLFFEATGATMENDRRFCGDGQKEEEEENCFVKFHGPNYSCGGELGGIFYAVKTHSGNHGTRVPIIKRTWATRVKHIGYFSDVEDAEIPAINLGVANTRRGHCGKTLAILRHFLTKDDKNNNDGDDDDGKFDWLMLADDDTLLSVPRLEQFVRCLPQREPVIAGQRYGYGFSPDGADGYDYPTGGAGILFSREAVKMIAGGCNCPSPDSPDDMIIGICARRLGIPINHSAAFHQARPIDYPAGHLRSWAGRHISFHKFEEVNPEKIYRDLLDDGKGEEEEEEKKERTTTNRNIDGGKEEF